jgi:hypothetical protein
MRVASLKLISVSSISVSELHGLFGQLSPSVVRLGCALSALPYIPYDVLRKCRRLFDPKLPTYLERVLCQSSLVDGCAADGFSLERSFRLAALAMLRSRCSEDVPGLIEELSSLRDLFSMHYQVLSPLLVVEAELAWKYVLLQPSAFSKEVEECLRDVVLSAVLENRDGILSWVAGASARLPRECIQGDTAWLLYQFCLARKFEMTPVSTPTTFSPGTLMALMSEHLPTVVVGIERKIGYIEFGPPSPERSVGIVLVESHPLILSFHDKLYASEPKFLRLERGETFKVECSVGEITLTNLAGQAFTLAPMDGDWSDEAQAADRAILNAQEALNRGTRLPATVIRPVEAGYVVSLNTIGATAFLISRHQELFEGDELEVTVDRVFRNTRWISARLAANPQASGTNDRSAILDIPVELVPATVRPGDTFPATIVYHGKLRGDRRSAHVFIDPHCSLSDVYVSHRPGHLRFGRAVYRKESGWYPPVGAKMEILASGVVHGDWQLRLRLSSTEQEWGIEESPLAPRQRTSATVVAVRKDGVEMEASNGQALWLPRLDIIPIPLPGEEIPLRVGDTMEVRVQGRPSHRHSNRYLVSQRALAEPYLHRLGKDTLVFGKVEHPLSNGEFLLLLDPIPGVSARPFVVRTEGLIGLRVRVGTRVSARVVRLLERTWLIVVNNVRPHS